MNESNLLLNQNVVVTGGATGIGLAIAMQFAGAGANVAIGSRRAETIENAVANGRSLKGRMVGHPLDVAVRTSVDEYFTWVASTLGPIDILVNAAGVNIKDRSMSAMHPSQWDEVMAINATGAYNCIYCVLPGMRTRKSGLIINISSVAGKRALALGGVAYSASKFAMTALGTCVSNEVGAEGIRVTNVYPGEVDTPILAQRPVPVSQEHRESILRPEDIANVVFGIANLPARVHVPELVVKPVHQQFY
jgi:NADP-dependent 3-hydroxy acid dehydrogenase YdfG